MTEDRFEQLCDRLESVRRRGDQAEARCPAHDDRRASLSIARGADGRVVLHCHAGCRWSDVLTAVGLTAGDAFGEPRMVAEYTYTDADGAPLYVVERWSPKDFRQRMAGGARRGPRESERVVYNLPTVSRVRSGENPALWFVEGEKDADTLSRLGYAATTTPGGAGKPWLPQYTDALAGCRVVIVADNDEPGRRWARLVADRLRQVAEPVVVVPPRGVKDITDLVDGGRPVTDLVPLTDIHGEAVSAAEYPTQQVEWLWPGRIPLHSLTLLEGDPGTGKSAVTVELVACLTTGRLLPDATVRPGRVRVGMLADEDSWSMTVRPRLQAAGADLHRVMHLKGLRRENGFLDPYSLTDIPTLRHDVQRLGLDLLVIDPLLAYLGTTLDTYKDQHVRSVLGPMVQWAEEDGLTILAVRHFTKGSGGAKAIYRGGGSIGFTGQARAVLQTGEHPSDTQEDQGRMVLAVAKCNLAPLAPSLGYRVVSDDRLNVARVTWEDLPVPFTANQLGKEDAEMHRAGREAVEWLRTWVEDHWTGEPFEWKTVLAAAHPGPPSKNTLERHREQVIRTVRNGPGGQRATRWVPISPPPTPLPTAPGKWGGREMGSDLSRRIDPSGYDQDDDRTSLPHSPIDGEMGTDPTAPFTSPPVNGHTPARIGETGKRGDGECSICGATDELLQISDDESRCVIHSPVVWSPT